jgi:hypothetical protein
MHSFMPYEIQITDADKPQASPQCSMSDIRGKTLNQIFSEFIKKHSSTYSKTDKDGNPRVFMFSDADTSKNLLYGYIESGEGGIKGKIVDTESKEAKSKYGPKDANTSRKVFYLKYRDNQKNALFLMHKINGRGAKTLFLEHFIEYLRSVSERLTVKVLTLSYENALIEWHQKGIVKEIRGYKLIDADKNADVVDKFKQKHKLELIAKPYKKGGNYGSFSSLNAEEAGNLVSFNDEIADEVKVLLDLEGRKKVLSVSSRSLPVCSIDFDELDVDFEEGEPKLESAKEFCDKLSQEIKLF